MLGMKDTKAGIEGGIETNNKALITVHLESTWVRYNAKNPVQVKNYRIG